MYCRRCGVQVQSLFCSGCGIKVHRSPQCLPSTTFTNEEDIIRNYFTRGFEYKNILEFLSRYHGLHLSLRTLKRRLVDYDIK